MDKLNREEAIARVLAGELAEYSPTQHMHLARAIIAADPWTKRVEQLETRLEMNFAFRDGKRISVPAGSMPDGIDCREETIRGIEDQRNKLRAEVERLRGSLRDCLHLLDTADGLWVTDLPQWQLPESGIAGTKLVADDGTYFRQTFRDTEAVKRARELVN